MEAADFKSRLDQEYQSLFRQSIIVDDTDPDSNEWQIPLISYFASNPHPVLPISEWDAVREKNLDTTVRKYQSGGSAYLAKLDEKKLTDLFIAAVPRSFRILLSSCSFFGDGLGPFIFPIKKCFALWGEIESSNLSVDDRLDLFADISDQYQRLETVFDELKKYGLEPLRGKDFWYFAVFESLLKERTASTDDESFVYKMLVERFVFEQQQAASLQTAYFEDKSFQRIFLASREASGYGLPSGIKIHYETQLALYEAWTGLPQSPSVKLIRSRVREIREKMEEMFALGLISNDPADRLHYQQAVFENLLFTIIQGESAVYETLSAQYSDYLEAGRVWNKSLSDLKLKNQDLADVLEKVEKNNADLLLLTKSVLEKSQKLPDWYDPKPYLFSLLLFPMTILDPGAPYRAAGVDAMELAETIKGRNELTIEIGTEKKKYLEILQQCLQDRIFLMRVMKYPEAVIQGELYSAYRGQLMGFEPGSLPYIHEAFTAEYLCALGLDMGNFDDGDPINQAIRGEHWVKAWRLMEAAVRQDFYMCTESGVFAEVSIPKGNSEESQKSYLQNFTYLPDSNRIKWRLDQLADLIAHDPDFVVFNEFVTDMQPLVTVMNTLLMGMHDEGKDQDLKGYLHPDMNRPMESVELLKSMSVKFADRYFSSSTLQTEALERAIQKLSSMLHNLDPDKLKLQPDQEELLKGLKSFVGFLAPRAYGKSPFQSIIEIVSDPGFTVYSFKRALTVYGPDIAGAVAGAVVLGFFTGGIGAVAAGASWLVRTVRFVGMISVVSAGSVAGKEAARMTMSKTQSWGWTPDYGARPLSDQYLKGEISGDEAFVRIFGEVGRELFDLFGFDRTDSNTGLGKLIGEYESGRMDLNGFIFRLLGEFGYQAMSMSGVSLFAKALAAAAARMILSENLAMSLVGRSIQNFAGIFDSLTDKIVMGTMGNVGQMSGFQLAKMFFSELAEEGGEELAGRLSGSQGMEWMVSVLNSSRVNLPDYAQTTMHSWEINEDGSIISHLYYQRGYEAKLMARLRSLRENNSSIEHREDGTIIFKFMDESGDALIQEYYPSDVPFVLRQALMVQNMGTMPGDILDDIGISGWNETGPVWVKNVDIPHAVRALSSFGFVVSEDVSGGVMVLKLSWTQEGVESSFIVPIPTQEISGEYNSVPINLVRRQLRLASHGKPRVLYWNPNEKSFLDDAVDSETGGHTLMHAENFSEMNLACVFQPGLVLSPGVLKVLQDRALVSRGLFTMRFYDALSNMSDPAYVDVTFILDQNTGSINFDIANSINIAPSILTDFRQGLDEAVTPTSRP